MTVAKVPHGESSRFRPQRVARRSTRALVALLGALCALAVAPVGASEYTVSPMRMQLDREARSTVVTLTNSGTDRIDFQLRAMAWTQDAEGKDRYDETAELVYFPKILSLEPSESRIIRVGIRSVPAAAEQTFRLFIEKIPAPNPAPRPPGAQVAINVRFALPIFVTPPVHQARGEIPSASVSRGELVFVLRNSGNEHFRMDEGIVLIGRDAHGNEVYTRTVEDRYLLGGTTKRYVTVIPKDACVQLATLELTAKTEQFVLSRRLDVNRTSCE